MKKIFFLSYEYNKCLIEQILYFVNFCLYALGTNWYRSIVKASRC